MKKPLGIDVFSASRERLLRVFQDFPRVYVSFSGGKDSTVLLHLTAAVARSLGRRFGILVIDLEGQYSLTEKHVGAMLAEYADCTDRFWVCLPLHLRNAVSMHQTHWLCWDPQEKESWIRPMPETVISDPSFFSFFWKGMEFEEFVPKFGEWYAEGSPCACLVGIRADESLNRFRTLARTDKERHAGLAWTTRVGALCYNAYPIYDWKTADIWTYHAKNPDKRYNELYDRMRLAGLTPHQMRTCQPYGDDQKRGLWLFHVIEPETWARVVARVSGANGGALYVGERGNVSGSGKVTLPSGHTWKSFCAALMVSMPPRTQEHYANKIFVFEQWWKKHGYAEGMPDESLRADEASRKAPSWRRICRALLRNDYWCKGLGFSQHRSEAYARYLVYMRKKRGSNG
jgi:predicted phosphoadenosine phosphosulfate sulfurtransferase